MFKNVLKVFVLGFALLQGSAVAADSISESQWQLPLKNDQMSTTLSSYKGQVIWIDFWASWCPPCKASFPWLNEMQQKYANQGFNIVAINVDEERSDAISFLRQVPASFDVYFDPEGNAPSQFQIQGMPTAILVDRDGAIKMFHIGFEEHQKGELEDLIRQAVLR